MIWTCSWSSLPSQGGHQACRAPGFCQATAGTQGLPICFEARQAGSQCHLGSLSVGFKPPAPDRVFVCPPPQPLKTPNPNCLPRALEKQPSPPSHAVGRAPGPEPPGRWASGWSMAVFPGSSGSVGPLPTPSSPEVAHRERAALSSLLRQEQHLHRGQPPQLCTWLVGVDPALPPPASEGCLPRHDLSFIICSH